MDVIKGESQDGLIGVLTYIDKETHQKLVKLSEGRQIALRELVRELLRWAGEHDAVSLIGQGVRLPLWPEDRQETTQHE